MEKNITLTLTVGGDDERTRQATATTLARRLRFSLPSAKIVLRHDNRDGNFLTKDAEVFEQLKSAPISVIVETGDCTLENSFVKISRPTYDRLYGIVQSGERFFTAIRREAEEKAFNIEQNSDNWINHVPAHLRELMTEYLTYEEVKKICGTGLNDLLLEMS